MVKMHEVFSSVPSFRKAMRSLAWQRGWPQSAILFLELLEALLVSKLYDDSLRVQVNNSRAPADFIANMPDLRKDLDDVQSMFDADVEARKPPAMPPHAADGQAADSQKNGGGESEEEKTPGAASPPPGGVPAHATV